ncbi:MAG: peptide-methionine (S)-S-oxide reductase MsrA [Armatimonadetes bacterium]|nr:peptide-methionine (S)-S-oxide reductase MsrA [Armatimonadota bacterium]
MLCSLLALSLAAFAPVQTQQLVVAGGCFWCVEAVYDELEGVVSAESGYTGGTVKDPTYGDVCSGQTGHAEAVRITFEPKKINERDLLNLFFTVHNPTTLNRQGPDSGTQYRSAIFYRDNAEKKLAESVIQDITKRKLWEDPIVTKLEPLQSFYRAEEYHQDYFAKYERASDSERARMNAGYCSAIIEPKVRHFRAEYSKKLKKKAQSE